MAVIVALDGALQAPGTRLEVSDKAAAACVASGKYRYPEDETPSPTGVDPEGDEE